MLAEIAAGARDDDAKFVGVVAAELGGIWTAGKFDGPLGTTYAPLTVGDQGKQR